MKSVRKDAQPIPWFTWHQIGLTGWSTLRVFYLELVEELNQRKNNNNKKTVWRKQHSNLEPLNILLIYTPWKLFLHFLV